MELISVTENYVFIKGGVLSNERHNRDVIFVDGKVFDIVVKCLERRVEFFKKLIRDDSLGKGTSRYFEEKWHDKLLKAIIDLHGLDEKEVSNSISAYLEY